MSPSFDDHVKLFFPSDPSQPLVLPSVTPDGIKFPDDAPRPQARDYTPRYFDAARQELVIDFVMHGDGPAPTWAERAAPGQVLGIGGPRGSFVVPMGFDWHVLIGDETALPAISRRIEELPASARVIALIEVPEADNEIALDTRARASVRWLHRNGVAAGYSTLLLEARARAEAAGRRGLCLGGGGVCHRQGAARDHGGPAWRGQAPHPRGQLLEARRRGRARVARRLSLTHPDSGRHRGVGAAAALSV